MKRLIVFILLMTLCFGAAGAEGLHLDLRCAYEGSDTEKILSFEAYEQGGNQICVSSLFPDYALEGSTDGSVSIADDLTTLRLLHPDRATAYTLMLKTLLFDCLKAQKGTTTQGIFAGELFDSAGTKTSCEFPLDDLIVLWMSQTDVPLFTSLEETGAVLKVSGFDENKYLSAEVCKNEETVMTVSADLSDQAVIRLLFSWVEAGRTYFREVNFQPEEGGILLSSAFYSGSGTSWRMVKESSPLFEEKLSVISVTENESAFYLELSAPTLSSPLCVSGSFETGDDSVSTRIAASAWVAGLEAEPLQMDATLESLVRPVSFEDKTLIHTDNESETAQISAPLLSGLSAFASDLMQKLPRDYQQILIKIIFE